jgi:SAM-dependent methyltransferase
MPAAQGVVKWPSASPSLCALTEEHEFPLVEGAVDRLILVHVIENAQAPSALLAECWRVLAPGGRLLAVVPNRASAWARVDITPFGHGRPYSRGQVTRLLREALFTPVGWAEALYIPPVQWRWFLRSAVALERFGAAFSMPMNGVHMVEAVKQLYRPIPVRKEKRRLIPAMEPQLAPQGVGRGGDVSGA